MPGTDNVIINVRERPYSTDINNLEALLSRTIMDLAGYSQTTRFVGIPTEAAFTNTVLGGLLVSPDGVNVSVSSGLLLQYSASLTPTPGAYDSSYRVGVLRSPETVVMPAPGSETYYLLEAQMLYDVLVQESRDVLDPGTGTFVPTLVDKIAVYTVQFQLLTGAANAPLPTGGNWVPIAIIRRPAGGGAVATTDIIDVRPLPPFGAQRPATPVRNMDRVLSNTPGTNTFLIQADCDTAFGRFAFVSQYSRDISTNPYISPSVTLAASTRYYLYIAPWSAQSLRPRSASVGETSEGILVLSDVAPDIYTQANSAAIDLPAPYAALAAPTGSAVYIGCVVRNSLNTAFLTMSRVDGKTRMFVASSFGTALSPPANGDNAITLTNVPPTARILKLWISWVGAAGAATPITLEVQPTGGITNLCNVSVDDSLTQREEVDVMVPTFGVATFDLNASAAADAGTTAYVSCSGWEE